MSRPKRGTRGSKSARPGWDARPDGGSARADGALTGHDSSGDARPDSVLGDSPRTGVIGDGVHEVVGFPCAHCGVLVPENAPGTGQRNHCPHCLWSLHVDIRPGDRASLCKGEMEPVALWASEGSELRVIHRCSKCGVMKPNRIAGDDSEKALQEINDRTVDALRANTGGDE